MPINPNCSTPLCFKKNYTSLANLVIRSDHLALYSVFVLATISVVASFWFFVTDLRMDVHHV